MTDANSSHERATRVRYVVLAMVCALSMITYIDRAIFPNAQGHIRDSLGLRSIADLTLAMTAFNLAYALFEVPTGWLGDVFGPRKTLLRIVLWWSTFIALTGTVGMTFGATPVIGFWGLVVIRFLFGMGEAGAYPNITRALYNWFPSGERGSAQGLVWMSARLMGGFTPLIWFLLVDQDALGIWWRVVFWMFGVIGIVWGIAFALTFHNRPDEHPGVNAAERDLICPGGTKADNAHPNVPWGKMLTSRTLWALCGMYFCLSYGWYFFMYYLPTYLKSQFPAEDGDFWGKAFLALLAGAPLLFGVPGCLLGGWLSDRHIRRTGDRRWGRSLYGVISMIGCSLCFVAAILNLESMLIFAVALAFAGFFNDMSMGPAWAACQDIGRQYAGVVSGSMNMIGNLGGALTTYLTGMLLGWSLAASTAADRVHLGDAAVDQMLKTDPAYNHQGLMWGYEVCLIMFAVVYLLGMFFWLMIDASKPIVPDEESTPA